MGNSLGATYPFAHFTEANGIPGSAVMGLAQDTTGCIWFATRGGLVRYDGTSWTTFGTESGLPVAWQGDVAVDHRGTVWSVATTTPLRVSFLDGGRWTKLPSPTDGAVGGETGPLTLGLGAGGETLIAVGIRNGVICLRSGETWHEVDLTAVAPVVHGLLWHDATLYVATNNGLWRVPTPITAESRAIAVGGVPPGPVYAVVANTDDGSLRVAGEGWLGELLPGGVRVDERVADLRLGASPGRVAAATDHLGGLYLGSADRSLYYHPATGCQELSRESGLVSNRVVDILVDREGQVWLATRRGVSRLTSREIACLDTNDDLYDDEVTAVLRRRDGSIVLGHETGLTFLDETPRHLDIMRSPEIFRRVIDLEEDRQGQLWVAMDRSGLARVGRDRAVRWYGAGDGLKGAVYTVVEDRDGTLWVGTTSGVYHEEGGRFARVPLPGASSEAPVIRRLVVARDGALMVGTVHEGAFRLQDGHCEHWVGDADDGFNSVYSFCEQDDGSWWVGTDGGICRLLGAHLEPLYAPGPAITRPVFAIARDQAGRTWMGTNAGAYMWNGRVLRHFGPADGICGMECNRDALTFDTKGRMWIGTDRGVAVYDDRFDRVLDVPLRLWIAGFEADGVAQPAEGEVRLPAGTRELIVRFRCPAFADESRLRFATRLEGFDDGWSAPSPNPLRETRYTNLSAGRYRFRVQAFDAVGRRSPVITSEEIVVGQALARRPWFIALLGALAFGFVVLVLSFVQSRRYQRRLAADVADRTAALAQSEALMRTESRRFATVLASISDGVLAVAEDGTITLANPAAAELLGCPGTTLSGKAVGSLMPGVEERARAALASEAVTGESRHGPTAHCVYRLERPDLGARELECSVAAITAPAAAPGNLVLAFRDVTDRRRLEQERIRSQKLESLGVLAGGIAHDFNNLLMVSLGNLSLLDDDARPDQQEALADMRAATDRAQRLTAQLLTVARGGAPQKRLTDLRTLLAEVSRLALAGTNVSLELDLADDLHDAEIDRGQVEQVITNILINARQASPAGGHIRLSARNVPEATAIEIRIRDDGEGIAPENIERIFEPYFTTKEMGTGLGLAICHSVVTRHGGTIAVDSRPGRGATFTLRLPASSARSLAVVENAERRQHAAARILLLDDEPSVRDLLVRMLTKLGHEPVAVADGEAAVAAYTAARDQGRPFAAAIMDLTVPGGMGGIDTLAQLRAIDPEIRAIVSSGYSRDPVLANYRQHGFAAALGKPFDSRALVDALGVVLRNAVNDR